MKFYHGSPLNLKLIKPMKAKGLTEFENQSGVYVCMNFNHAALYALGKILKGKTAFAVTPRRLIIVGSIKPIFGYVYEVESNNFEKGERGQFRIKENVKVIKKFKINPKNYKDKIIYVKNIDELKRKLK